MKRKNSHKKFYSNNKKQFSTDFFDFTFCGNLVKHEKVKSRYKVNIDHSMYFRWFEMQPFWYSVRKVTCETKKKGGKGLSAWMKEERRDELAVSQNGDQSLQGWDRERERERESHWSSAMQCRRI